MNMGHQALTYKVDELYGNKENISAIFKNSNATPITHPHQGIGYMCSFCRKQFPDPADLKKHTIQDHPDISKASFMQQSLFTFYVNLDITNLKCKICDSNIDTVDAMIDHLEDKHYTRVYKGATSRILPFKFDTENLQCCICFNNFNKFKTLLNHMHNAHYRNFVCDICEAGYVTMLTLQRHQVYHQNAIYKCSICPKIYKSRGGKIMHETMTHSSKNKIVKCNLCSETFKWQYTKEKHVAEVHGIRSSGMTCKACDKNFSTRVAFVNHQKRYHLGLKLHACSQCDKKFTTSQERKGHELTHSAVKSAKCELCLKAYKSKKSLREHMRIHNNEMRFKCEYCGKEFIQKCNWKTHMKKKHDENL